MIASLSRLKADARNAARAAAFSVVGAVFGLVGIALLSTALWVLLAAEFSALVAFTGLGALYVLLGMVFLLLGSSQTGNSSRPEPEPLHSQPPPKDPFFQMAEGFAFGLQAGRAARERRR